MKIQFAMTGFLPHMFGGAEMYTRNLAKELIAREHDISIITPEVFLDNTERLTEIYDGIPITRLPFSLGPRPRALRELKLQMSLYDIAMEWFESNRPEVLHVTNYWHIAPLIFAAMHSGIPVVGTHVGYDWKCRHSVLLNSGLEVCTSTNGCIECYPDFTEPELTALLPMRQTLMELMATGYSHHHCPCELMAETISEFGADPTSISTWPYGVPEKALSSQRVAKSSDNKLRLAFIGRWNRIKGIDILLDAMEQIQGREDIILTLYGEQEVWNKDSYAEAIEQKAELLTNVRSFGRFEPEQLGSIHHDIDCIVTPSIWPENSPVSMLEALAIGTPVICADGRGMTNLITHKENGLVFSNRNAEDLAHQICSLADDPSLLASLQSNTECLRTITEDAEAFEAIYAEASAIDDAEWLKRSHSFLDTIRFADAALMPSSEMEKVKAKIKCILESESTPVAIYGCGKHTLRLLGQNMFDQLNVTVILDENRAVCGGSILGIPVRHISEAHGYFFKTIIASSDAFEEQMMARLSSFEDKGISVTGFYQEDVA